MESVLGECCRGCWREDVVERERRRYKKVDGWKETVTGKKEESG